jgi:uncharacterized phage-associated protein
MREAGIEQLPFETKTVPRTGPVKDLLILGEPLRDVDLDVFSKSDLKVFDEILEKYGNLNFQQLFDLTHNHYAYKRAWRERGHMNASVMRYEEMIEDEALRQKIVDDIGPISAHL